jgi:hypothetical protein
MKLFALLLNCTTFDRAFDIYNHIMSIYADPYNSQVQTGLLSLLNKFDLSSMEIDEYLDVEKNDEQECARDKPLVSVIDDFDVTDDAIIHQSPFTVKAREKIKALDNLLSKRPIEGDTTNDFYSKEVVMIFYKWFAYLPLWTCIMSDYLDR